MANANEDELRDVGRLPGRLAFGHFMVPLNAFEPLQGEVVRRCTRGSAGVKGCTNGYITSTCSRDHTSRSSRVLQTNQWTTALKATFACCFYLEGTVCLHNSEEMLMRLRLRDYIWLMRQDWRDLRRNPIFLCCPLKICACIAIWAILRLPHQT